MINKYTKLALFLLLISGVFGFIQNKFYGYIDKDEILVDSIFLPLSYIALIIAFLIIVFVAIWYFVKYLFKNIKK